MREYKHLIAMVVVGVMPAVSAFGDTITLRASVRMPAQGEVIRLADIAVLEGPAAESLGERAIAQIDNPHKVTRLSVRDVRRSLNEASVNWGKVNLSGNEVVIRPRHTGAVAPPQAMTGVSVSADSRDQDKALRSKDEHEQTAQLAANIFNDPTLRGAIARLATRRAGVTPSDLRLRFFDIEKKVLDLSQDAYRFDIQPTTGSSSDRYGFQVRLWADGRVQDTHLVSVKPLLRTETVQAARDLSRHEIIAQSDIEVVEDWLEPTQRILLASREQAIGSVVDSRIKVGEVLRRKDMERRTLIERGDRVTVRCLVGGFVVAVQAEARNDGAEGELVECRKLGERETFVAKVTGPHEAVLHLDRSTQQR